MVLFTFVKIDYFLDSGIEILSVLLESVEIDSLLVEERKNDNLVWLHGSQVLHNVNKLPENVANYWSAAQNKLVVLQLEHVGVLVEKFIL